jgi:hypothetical protein
MVSVGDNIPPAGMDAKALNGWPYPASGWTPFGKVGGGDHIPDAMPLGKVGGRMPFGAVGGAERDEFG